MNVNCFGGMVMARSLQGWTPRPRPARLALEGRHVRLEPLDPAAHGEGLFAASTTPDAGERFRWLAEYPPAAREDFEPWLVRSSASSDPLFFAVIDRHSEKIAGRQALMRIDTSNGVAEVGNILWTGLVARRPAATEAIHLFAAHVFNDLGYRRFEWKCNARNEPSRRAAERFGFAYEGTFRNHMVIKGENRDTAWFAMTDEDWPRIEAGFKAWLSPDNFDRNGMQIKRLEELRRAAIRAN
jgi:RimJ/RimL family protein N-acetyltransferase